MGRLLVVAVLGACSLDHQAYTGDDAGGGSDAGGPEFGTPPGFDGDPLRIVHAGSSYYIGGNFQRVSTHRAAYFAELDDSGETKSCMGGFDGVVSAIQRFGTAVYVGGNFRSYRGQAANYIAKLDAASCALDPTFDPQGVGFDANVTTLAIANNAVYVAGNFRVYGGSGSANLVAKLDLATGSLDTTFSPPANNGFDNTVIALGVSNGAIFASGQFTRYRGVPVSQIAKLDLTTGALDPTFSTGTGFTASGFVGHVNPLVVLPGQTAIVVGGDFDAYRGMHCPGVARLDAMTGDPDTTFAVPDDPTNNDVGALAVANDAIYISRSKLIKVDFQGNPDPVFAATSSGRSIAITGSAIYLASGATQLTKLNLVTGAVDASFKPEDSTIAGFDGAIDSLVHDGASLWVGGNFGVYGGTTVNRLVKLDDTTFAIDRAFSPDVNGFDGEVDALVAAGESLYVGGQFTAYRGVASSANHIAKLDLATGALDTSFSAPGAMANGFDGAVAALAVDSDALYVGGGFGAYRGIPASANSIAKLSLESGAIDTTFGPPGTTSNGFDGGVHALVVADGAVYAGGMFSSYRGIASSATNLAKLDAATGVIDTTFDPPGNNGTSGQVAALVTTPAGLYVGGRFDHYRGAAVPGDVLKLDLATGVPDPSFSGPTLAGSLNAIAVGDNRIYLGGIFAIGATGPCSVLCSSAAIDATTGTFDSGFAPITLDNDDRRIEGLARAGDTLIEVGYFVGFAGANAAGAVALDPTTGLPK